MSGKPPASRTQARLQVAATAAVGLLLTAAPINIPTAAAAGPLAGKVVFLDPGHNGANDASIGRQVPTGRGGTKDCQATGTKTDNGYPEHTFTWDTTLRIRQKLDTLGARTAMSRQNDTTIGPCVDQRAEMANTLHPNAVVSIHADGGPPSGRGFHVNYSAPPLNATQAGPSVQFARVMRDQLQACGMSPADYIGRDGLYGRADLAGLNLARYPSILVELGNMKNPGDAAEMETPAGRQRYADAVVRGITAYLTSARN
ncbi:Rv3717 family N-acetylmuramoyl-L-alanine amidase [Mycobacterium servetii]|uniref:Rv3717 family N-acetylmuramoyl-L-alanine amidase n=1 Tax=Mycobacterium servetii TaxID=3237418 RepID=A0ABV4C990_9MYCO